MGTDCRYFSDIVDCPCHRRAGELWHCAVFNRTITSLVASAIRDRHRAFGWNSQHYLWNVGAFCIRAFFAEHIQPWLQNSFENVPGIGFLFEGPFMGIGMLTAGIILAIMVIPYIASVMRDVFDIVPPMLKESAYALGATTWEVVWRVVLPYTKAGVIGGVMLGLGRALGETMAVTFVIGNAHQLHSSLFMPGNSIASALANEFTEADGELYTSALIELGLILFSLLLWFWSVPNYCWHNYKNMKAKLLRR